jgi:hypothetical protein
MSINISKEDMASIFRAEVEIEAVCSLHISLHGVIIIKKKKPDSHAKR